MLIKVGNALKFPGQSFPFETRVAIEPMVVLDDPVRFEDVRIAGTMMGDGTCIAITGEIQARLVTRCCRCLDPVERPMTARLSEVYGETENPDDPDQRLLEGYSVDLTDAAREALLLELPMRILCRDDCKGLCPHCGINLNHELCTCQEGTAGKNPFSALSGMLSQSEEV